PVAVGELSGLAARSRREIGTVARAGKRDCHRCREGGLRQRGCRYSGRCGAGGSPFASHECSVEMKFIFVTGGVVSSLGKGLTAAALGTLLENRGLKVALQKFDPYLNVDPGTMSPYQHGEVYVLDDGAETDLDLGHYERFTNV